MGGHLSALGVALARRSSMSGMACGARAFRAESAAEGLGAVAGGHPGHERQRQQSLERN
jgi:hypothetical protein